MLIYTTNTVLYMCLPATMVWADIISRTSRLHTSCVGFTDSVHCNFFAIAGGEVTESHFQLFRRIAWVCHPALESIGYTDPYHYYILSAVSHVMGKALVVR